MADKSQRERDPELVPELDHTKPETVTTAQRPHETPDDPGGGPYGPVLPGGGSYGSATPEGGPFGATPGPLEYLDSEPVEPPRTGGDTD
ncbi:hypothetical protein FHS29_003967 [Saccharothrix tamanrassetensis]|uniref:Uncharacterized protein n=1 Tax=Saccharothrix tamanrassetensis TaxID=1051531 RepID=A0A841CFR4_9PSEU|nr:hypothetical protein [Saccharothrix tamanrassetensis]